MAQIHIQNSKGMCYIHKYISTELNMHFDFTGPLSGDENEQEVSYLMSRSEKSRFNRRLFYLMYCLRS